jgi:hypothetical protein
MSYLDGLGRWPKDGQQHDKTAEREIRGVGPELAVQFHGFVQVLSVLREFPPAAVKFQAGPEAVGA